MKLFLAITSVFGASFIGLYAAWELINEFPWYMALPILWCVGAFIGTSLEHGLETIFPQEVETEKAAVWER
jgi:hypothetical protein